MARKLGKRHRRFGRIYSRKWGSGRLNWYVVWFDRAQKRRVTRAIGDNREDAVTFLNELERRIRLKLPAAIPTQAELLAPPTGVEQAPPPAAKTFVEYAEDLLEKRLVGALAPATVTLYRCNLAVLGGFFGPKSVTVEVAGKKVEETTPGHALAEITPAEFQKYRVWRRGARRSPQGKATKPISEATLNRDHAFAALVLNHAVADGLLDASPLRGLKKLREPRKPRRYLTKVELGILIAKVPQRFKGLLLAAIYTGARKGELTALRWRDVDFERGKIAIARTKVGNCDSLDLHPALAAELLRLKNQRDEPPPEEHVFLSWHGTPYRDVRKVWMLTLVAAGLDGRGLGFHALRHSFATHFLENGGAVTDLQMQLGHSKLETTQLYANALSERRRETVMALEFAAPARGSTNAHVARTRTRRAS
jgi:integrase